MTTTADPSTWGWTASGYAQPTLQNWIDYLLARADYHLGVSVPRSPSDPVYQLTTAMAEGLDTAAELVAMQAAALDPATAVGAALDTVARFNGVTRLGAAPSTATVRLTGTNGVVVPVGTRVSDASGTAIFATDAAVTLTISAGGSSYYQDVTVTCIDDGPVTADAITRIVNPISGLVSVALAPGESVSPGRDIESDAELRVRIISARYALGTGTEDAIRAALLDVVGVDSVRIYPNREDVEDSEGRPAHSFEAVVWGAAGDPDDSLVGPAIIGQLHAGLGATFGDDSYTQTDEYGVETTVNWNFGTTGVVYVRYTITEADAALLPADYVERLRTATVEHVAALAIGAPLRVSALRFLAARTIPELVAATVETSINGVTWAESDRTASIRQKLYIDPDDASTHVLVVTA